MEEYLAFWMFLAVFLVLLSGFPVAFALSGTALGFAALGIQLDLFDAAFLHALPNRLFGIINNETLIAVPLFVFMGVMLERAQLAEDLLESMADLFGSMRGGLGIAVTLVGMLMAASTGIVGATVVTMGLLSLPTMLRNQYDPAISCGTICASGTLGQIIPPSIVLVLLGDVMSTAYQQAQLDMGIFAPETISVGDLFAGALLPGLGLVFFYLLYIILTAQFRPESMPSRVDKNAPKTINYPQLFTGLLPPLLLMFAVLGSIIAGIATPTEAASVGASGALLLSFLRKKLTLSTLRSVMQTTTKITSMVFMILIGAALFSLVFRGFNGDEIIIALLSDLPGGKLSAVFLVMIVMFALGFVLDFIEITFVIVPIIGPILLGMGIDPVWLGIMIAINLQTSFLTPPFGFALFYLRGVAPAEITTLQIYRGVMPFILIQLCMLGLLAYWPSLATWLPEFIYKN
ncbi:MAG: TRAP transporter large permease subunit [Methylococcales bacterium]|jgi:tripartite ATP-independent transporter DctM subunit|nr:TRAP transporter large permease subunit [Methylococcales bacterium]MBT3698942.1 TRAP transporter large permease subunit [Methylococcales bacterium]MBT3815494.1 TRAP transporter large permease subunit [Methylococcales bacterium]MBT4032943.1 TRAP transporter large permease subunit [Methylococcales bacterium]MBT4347687.1 TRAP transporter large permease subunit [Methylococcales bacterium]